MRAQKSVLYRYVSCLSESINLYGCGWAVSRPGSDNHQADGFINYTVFSLWDTYRALHPLFNFIQPSRNAEWSSQ
jgi:hypothetical protein